MLESLFNKIAGLQVFICQYCNLFRALILKKIYERLLLSVIRSDYLSENTPKPFFKGNFAQIFI